ncbi:MAG TPA: hypothetical protein VIY54_07520 [Steroidobacteraceae bacterium]
MDTKNPQTWVIAIIVVLALIALAIVAARSQRQRQSRRLQQRFGPEYERLVAAHGNRTKAESELRAREKRVERLTIVPLAPAEAARFSQEWGKLQSRFVDNPKGVVAEADRLVRDLMVKRGYPMGDFERRAADISVDHPTLVDTYRSAQSIAARDQHGQASTEELRKAVVYYRALFDELLEVRGARQTTTPDNAVVHS